MKILIFIHTSPNIFQNSIRIKKSYQVKKNILELSSLYVFFEFSLRNHSALQKDKLPTE